MVFSVKCFFLCFLAFVILPANGRSEAFLTAPLPAYARGLAAYDVTETNRRAEILQRLDDDEGDDDDDNDDGDDEDSILKNAINGRTVEQRGGSVYVIEFESETDDVKDASTNNTTESVQATTNSPLDPWSIVWYIGSFGGLVAFFLVVSCSEWCCRRGARPMGITYTQPGEPDSTSFGVQDAPPPPYHLFAPPPYDSIYYGDITDKTSGEKLDIFVIAVPQVHGAPPRQTDT
ncbi:uncharacterized protein LOC124411721 [Diprion similis]|uniref:uncharacterized protein LOC124411721 n=1 Tax=Diprion similis TaxID=362088 RepID=UPI001EF94637|nr:uncharacterized protein LOC124411721 [Diprion similis]